MSTTQTGQGTDPPTSQLTTKGSQTTSGSIEVGKLRNDGDVGMQGKEIGFPKRYILALMIFLGFCVLYALRVNLNVAIGAMCNNHTIYVNGFYVKKVAEFNWDSKLQGAVLGSFYYGYIVLQIPGGYLALRFGGTRIFGLALFIASILTLLTPLAARTSVYALIVLRVMEGVVLGVLFPCNHAIWGKWAPPLERSRLFSITAAGCPVGTILTMPLTGLLTKYGFDGGWASVFYVFGAVGLLWFFVWCLAIHPTPSQHPTISSQEKEYIEKSLHELKDEKPSNVPWKAIFTSVPVWATIVANFTADWGLYTILICIPRFFQKVLGFDIATTGFLVSLPYLIKAIVGPSGGVIADLLITRGMSVRNVRRFIFTVGCSTASVFIVAVGYAKSKGLAIALLCMGVGITGLNATGYAVNILDIAPKYAGIIIGISNVFGSMPGFISPQIVGFITTKNGFVSRLMPNGFPIVDGGGWGKNVASMDRTEVKEYTTTLMGLTAGEWQLVFWITAIVYAIGIVFFFLTVSGDKQPWADGDTPKNPAYSEGQGDGREKEPLLGNEDDENKKAEDKGSSQTGPSSKGPSSKGPTPKSSPPTDRGAAPPEVKGSEGGAEGQKSQEGGVDETDKKQGKSD